MQSSSRHPTAARVQPSGHQPATLRRSRSAGPRPSKGRTAFVPALPPPQVPARHIQPQPFPLQQVPKNQTKQQLLVGSSGSLHSPSTFGAPSIASIRRAPTASSITSGTTAVADGGFSVRSNSLPYHDRAPTSASRSLSYHDYSQLEQSYIQRQQVDRLNELQQHQQFMLQLQQSQQPHQLPAADSYYEPPAKPSTQIPFQAPTAQPILSQPAAPYIPAAPIGEEYYRSLPLPPPPTSKETFAVPPTPNVIPPTPITNTIQTNYAHQPQTPRHLYQSAKAAFASAGFYVGDEIQFGDGESESVPSSEDPPFSFSTGISTSNRGAPATYDGATASSSGDRAWDPSAVMFRLGSKQLDFTSHDTPTLFTLLKPYVPDTEAVNEEYKSFQTIVSWMMGGPEASLAHFAHWRPCARVYEFITPRMLGLPKVDLKLSRVTAKLRRSVLLVASMQYRCYYCAAHAAAIGDIVKGSYRAAAARAFVADRRKGSISSSLPPPILSKITMPLNGSLFAEGSHTLRPEPQVLTEAAKIVATYTSPPSPDPDEPSNVQNSRWTRRENSQDTSSRSRSRSKPKPTDADVLRLVTAASRIPSKVTPELKKLAMEGIGEDGYQTVACIAGSFGWLNAITDTVGMELGLNDALFARSELAAVGWTGGRHAPPGLKEHQESAASSGSEPPMNFWSSTSQSTLSRSQIMHAVANETTPRTGLARLIDYQLVLSHVAASSAQSDPWGSQIPTTHKKIDDWLVEKMGFLPSYVGVIKNLEAKRAVCLMLWVFLVRNNGKKGGGMGDPCVEGEPCEWTAGAKALMFYVYSTQIGNLLLRGHAAFLALRNHVPISVLLSTASSMPTHEPRLDAALDLVRATASLRRSFPATLNRRVFDTANSTKGIMELVNSIGLFNMLHRMSAMLAPEPVKFEKEVREFLSMFAPVLGMDPDDASPQSTEERRVVDPLQFLYPN